MSHVEILLLQQTLHSNIIVSLHVAPQSMYILLDNTKQNLNRYNLYNTWPIILPYNTWPIIRII